ncbi:MAG: hypothetical protein K0Q93_1964 [Nocardioidaceae bacterium]|nr:hypothetical protein [Nocardioidaceae bacterium]
MALTGSGVIFAIVVVAWLCYLVPLTLRRHDEAVRSRSVDRFSAAMRVLGRTDGAGSAGATPAPPATTSTAVPVRRPASTRGATAVTSVSTAGPTADSGAVRGGARSAASTAATRRAARAAAARRRRVLVVLLLVTVTVTAAAILGWLPLWSPAVPVAAVVGFLVLARWQVTRARTAAWEESLRTSATPPTATRSSATGPAATGSAATGPSASGSTAAGQPAAGSSAAGSAAASPLLTVRPAGTVPADPPTGASTVSSSSRPPVVVPGGPGPADPRAEVTPEPTAAPEPEPFTAAPASSLWDPVPVTLPTYVSKPRAEPGIRTIDLTGSEARTSGHLAGGQSSTPHVHAVSGRAPEVASEHAAAGPDAVVRRAVGD